MGVALGSEHTTHHHLRLGETGAQHVHERNRAALPDVADRCAKVRLTGAVQGVLKPGRGVGRVPAGRTAARFKGHFGLIRCVVFEQRFHLGHGLRRVHQRRQPQA